jgi:prevent-host-death family protein
MPTVSIEEAQARLPELIDQLSPGEEVIITRNTQPVARLIGQAAGQPVFGRGKGKLQIVAEDEEHLEHFKDYMP